MPNDEHLANRKTLVLLEELVALTRVIAISEARKTIGTLLNSPKKKKVFAMSDGTRSVREIAASAGVDKNTVSKWWNEWQAFGLLQVVPGTQGTR